MHHKGREEQKENLARSKSDQFAYLTTKTAIPKILLSLTYTINDTTNRYIYLISIQQSLLSTSLLDLPVLCLEP